MLLRDHNTVVIAWSAWHPPQKLIGRVFRGAPSLQLPFPVAVPLSVEVELVPLVQRGANVDW